MPCDDRTFDLRPGRAQVFLAYARDPRVRNPVDKLPEVVLETRTELPGKPAPLILLLMNVTEGRLDVRCREAEAAANDWRTAARAQCGEAIRDIAEQEVEAV